MLYQWYIWRESVSKLRCQYFGTYERKHSITYRQYIYSNNFNQEDGCRRGNVGEESCMSLIFLTLSSQLLDV